MSRRSNGVHIIRQPFLLRAKKSSKRKKDCITSDEELTSTNTWQITWPSVFCSIDQGMPEAFCNITWLACSRNNDTTEYEIQRPIFKDANIRTQEVARLMQHQRRLYHEDAVTSALYSFTLKPCAWNRYRWWTRLNSGNAWNEAPLRVHEDCMIHG